MSKKHLDTFSGYGGFTQGVQAETIGFSEVEPHAIAVLKYHYPEIKNYGDINEITDLPDFDLLTGGSPCQDLSVAGKQAGLGGARSGLFFQFIRLLKEKQPANFIWENVKGTLSSSDGWDFARVQIEMAEAGYAFQWQVLNAKYFGVPQSRERVFVVGHIGGECKREVFFEQQDRGKNIRELGNVFAEKENYISGKSGYAAGRIYDTDGVGATLSANGGGLGGKTGLYAVNVNHGELKIQDEQVSNCLDANFHKGFDNHGQRTGVLAVPLKFLDRNQKNYQGEYSFTVDTVNSGGVMILNNNNAKNNSKQSNSQMPVLQKALDEAKVSKRTVNGLQSVSETSLLRQEMLNTRLQGKTKEEKSSMDDSSLPRSEYQAEDRDLRNMQTEKENGHTSQGRELEKQQNTELTGSLSQLPYENTSFRIRRLTPLEAERLMGLPDDWTRYGVKPDGAKYELSDSARYKLCGNGVVVNVVKEIINNLFEKVK